jgi:3',5'-cyclic-AMP phosphodiesterase
MLRRSFLKTSLSIPVASMLLGKLPVASMISRRTPFSLGQALPTAAVAPKSQQNDFDFVFFTDCHLEPELSGVEGCVRCFSQINETRPEFCIAGGDQVFDVCQQDLKRAHMLFKLYQKTERDNLHGKVYYTVGNHDVIGINQKSPVEPGDLEYGKRLYEDYFGKLYYSFDYKGWHFIVLDSIGIEYYKIFKARFDQAQLDWLKADLAVVGPTRPVVVVTHVPIATVLGSLSPKQPDDVGPIAENSFAVHALLANCNLKAVLQGHLHVWQKSEYRGTQYLISGAVSGAWWEGPMYGTPEGYTLCQVRGGEIHLSYVTYPWTAAVQHKNS